MPNRLLSFFSDFERTLAADDPSPDNGTWETERTVNYSSGLARMNLSVRLPDGTSRPRGSVFTQSFKLADGTNCLKAQFSWAGKESTSTHAIYDKPGCNWTSETRRLAAEWMAVPGENAFSDGVDTAPTAVDRETETLAKATG